MDLLVESGLRWRSKLPQSPGRGETRVSPPGAPVHTNRKERFYSEYTTFPEQFEICFIQLSARGQP